MNPDQALHDSEIAPEPTIELVTLSLQNRRYGFSLGDLREVLRDTITTLPGLARLI